MRLFLIGTSQQEFSRSRTDRPRPLLKVTEELQYIVG